MSKLALVLGGGGARGAYEAGVLRYVVSELPKVLGKPLRFDCIVGTSAGAINGAFLASEARDLPYAAQRLAERWANIGISDIYRIGARQFLRVPRSLFAGTAARSEVALLEAQGLHRMIRESVRWEGISESIEAGQLDAFAVACTELSTSRNVVFIQGRRLNEGLWQTRNPYVRPRPAVIGPEHVLASSAIPLLLPPVQVDGRWYIDGGLGLLTPLGPALTLGADRILALSLRKRPTPEEVEKKAQQTGAEPPTWAQVIGKTMNVVLLDRSDLSIQRLERMNRILAWGEGEYGPEFSRKFGQFMGQDRGQGFRPVRSLLITPSKDLGCLAVDLVADSTLESTDEITRGVLRFLARAGPKAENDALSYLLFDPRFLRELLDLGWADARARRDELLEFFAEGEGS